MTEGSMRNRVTSPLRAIRQPPAASTAASPVGRPEADLIDLTDLEAAGDEDQERAPVRPHLVGFKVISWEDLYSF